MVRMDKPSPIQVGREFVRQYYTLLNKAPELLHRFYGVNSCYIHGGGYCNGEPEDGVIGQTEIHKKITSLSFKDCHTKVRQVDAHSSISGGVVVQVIGELSNDRNPLRKFMQTFVLAPQGDNPFKFYVHNDIFRYADEVFPDEVSVDHIEDEPETTETEPEIEQNYFQEDRPNPITTNGMIEEVSRKPDQRQVTTPSPSLPIVSESPEKEGAKNDEEPASEPTRLEPVVPSQPDPVEEKETPASQPPIESQEKSETTPQQFSWAALASKNTPAQANTQQGTVVKGARSEEPDTRDRPPPRQQRQPRGGPPPTQQQQSRPTERGPRDDDRNVDRGNQRRPIRYNDSQQIFVGNLPVDITEADLREHFADFGAIMEVRINHSHVNNPSFGFIIFEEAKAVEEVLRQMPTNFKNNKRINIEEKKQRIQNREMRRGGGDNRRENPRGPRNMYRR